MVLYSFALIPYYKEPHPSTCLKVLPIKGQRAADQRVQDDSEAPHVHFWTVIFLPLEKLRCSIRWWTTERIQLVPQRELVAKAKVGDLDVGVSIQQKVLCLTHTQNHVNARHTENNRTGGNRWWRKSCSCDEKHASWVRHRWVVGWCLLTHCMCCSYWLLQSFPA